jgi:hypothetical protein
MVVYLWQRHKGNAMDRKRERRKNRRFKARRKTFAFLRSALSNNIIAARLVDISDRGLRVEHMAGEFSPYTQVELDIVLPAGEACMQQLPGITIYDCEIGLDVRNKDPGRICGIGFRDLTVSQQSYVQSLVGYFMEDDEAPA